MSLLYIFILGVLTPGFKRELRSLSFFFGSSMAARIYRGYHMAEQVYSSGEAYALQNLSMG